jgi:glycine hydroxymethyltransferase
MIASENFAPVAVMEAQGSALTNKYAYRGVATTEAVSTPTSPSKLAIDRVKALFRAGFANAQPHSSARAIASTIFAVGHGAKPFASHGDG